MLALGSHIYLSIFIAAATVFTIFVVSSSYSQIIELFPSGGGGYLVASKLLSPNLGMVSGSALLIDYVLTITVSISSGADAIFSFLPLPFLKYKLVFGLFGTHVFIILYAIFSQFMNIPEISQRTIIDLHHSQTEFGILGTFLFLIHAYSMGAGTYTGIEAVSNGLPILREPKIHTARKTMVYMAVSLSVMVMGLMVSYMLFNVQFQDGKTLNAVLFERATSSWNPAFSYVFVIITLISEGTILFVAAQTGFLDGPRVLSNMALDHWVPTRFASLSDRLVTQNGILLMGLASFVLMFLTGGSVTFLLVLYSINVFLTFSLSQLGMVRHWWQVRHEEKKWIKKIVTNGVGLCMTTFILLSVTIVKFHEGGWITVVITSSVIIVVLLIKKHYTRTSQQLKRLDEQLTEITSSEMAIMPASGHNPVFDPAAKTAVLLVNGYSGTGIHSLLSIFKFFGDTFKNFVFIEIGLIDAGVFKGVSDIEQLKIKINEDIQRYIDFMNNNGFFADGFTSTDLDVVAAIIKLIPEITSKYKNPIFFGGQIVMKKDTMLSRFLHNYTVFAVQRELYYKGIEFVILPIKL